LLHAPRRPPPCQASTASEWIQAAPAFAIFEGWEFVQTLPKDFEFRNWETHRRKRVMEGHPFLDSLTGDIGPWLSDRAKLDLKDIYLANKVARDL
jgi:hypothetical protein